MSYPLPIGNKLGTPPPGHAARMHGWLGKHTLGKALLTDRQPKTLKGFSDRVHLPHGEGREKAEELAVLGGCGTLSPGMGEELGNLVVQSLYRRHPKLPNHCNVDSGSLFTELTNQSPTIAR